MEKVDVEPTAQVIDNMVSTAERVALELKRTAAMMREKNDLTYASEAINTVSNMLNQMRLDLLVTRPLREMSRADR